MRRYRTKYNDKNKKGRRDNGRQSLPTRKARERRVVNTIASTGYPDSEIATIRYSDEIGINPATTYGQYTFRGNSCFDPDETGIGHQPMYFDQYSEVYSKYKVISSRISVTAANYNAAASAVIVVVPSSEIITITSYAIAMEQPYAKRTELLPVSTRGGVQSSLRSGIRTQKILGLSSAQFASEDYSATTGATPSSVWYWNIAAFDISALSVRLVVDIDYRVIFYDRKAPSLSYGLKIVKTSQEIAQRQKDKNKESSPVVNYVVPYTEPVSTPPMHPTVSPAMSPPMHPSVSPWSTPYKAFPHT